MRRLTVLALIVVVAACGGGSDDSTTTTTEPQDTPESEPPSTTTGPTAPKQPLPTAACDLLTEAEAADHMGWADLELVNETDGIGDETVDSCLWTSFTEDGSLGLSLWAWSDLEADAARPGSALTESEDEGVWIMEAPSASGFVARVGDRGVSVLVDPGLSIAEPSDVAAWLVENYES